MWINWIKCIRHEMRGWIITPSDMVGASHAPSDIVFDNTLIINTFLVIYLFITADEFLNTL